MVAQQGDRSKHYIQTHPKTRPLISYITTNSKGCNQDSNMCMFQTQQPFNCIKDKKDFTFELGAEFKIVRYVR